MVLPPLSRDEFAEKNRRLIAADRLISESELAAWERGRDWLVGKIAGKSPVPERRASPRRKVSLPAHIAGIGDAFTEEIGFAGIALRAPRLPRLPPGEETSVRINLGGRSIYALGRVVWSGSARLGLVIVSLHPADERALQAAVCEGHLDDWA